MRDVVETAVVLGILLVLVRIVVVLDLVVSRLKVSLPEEKGEAFPSETTKEEPCQPDVYRLSSKDEVLADIESKELETHGTSTAQVCAWWAEQDEREALDEEMMDQRIRAIVGRRQR